MKAYYLKFKKKKDHNFYEEKNLLVMAKDFAEASQQKHEDINTSLYSIHYVGDVLSSGIIDFKEKVW